MTIQTNNDNLNYLIDPTFFLKLTNYSCYNDKDDYRDSFSLYYMPNVEIKEFAVLIDGKSFFDLSVKNEEDAYGIRRG